jgi:hypothetical protein
VHQNSQLCARKQEKIHRDNETIHMVITRQGNNTLDKNATSISGNGDGGERQLLVMLIP